MLYAFGRSDNGQLGIGAEAVAESGMFYETPQRVNMPRGVVMKRVAAGDSTAMALTIDNELYTWGFEGTTGHAGFDDRDCVVPRKLEIRNGAHVHAMDGGGQHGIVLVTT